MPRRTWRSMGRYLFTPTIFEELEHVEPASAARSS
jgi:UTP-glucose-1-phosphate uridylyltransferase